MSEELNELKEHAEHAKEDPKLAPVSVTMAILAVLVAVVSLLGHRSHTEEVLLQATASDQWAYYQAKNIRRHEDEMFSDFTSGNPLQIRPSFPGCTISIRKKQNATKTNRRKLKIKR